MAVFKAHVRLVEGGESTGWGTVSVNDFDEYIEAAETKALGRALAALGYGTQFCTDFETQDKEKEREAIIVDSPVSKPRDASWSDGVTKGRQEGRGVTEAQVKAILAIGRSEYNWSDSETNKRSAGVFGKDVKELSRKQASELIDKLKNQKVVA
ncbi:MAG: hypothetical protein EXR50_03200 [Dehalococcoidia bacterium]|nr:hypothetical protein [Dehalococcoidia bacterium]